MWFVLVFTILSSLLLIYVSLFVAAKLGYFLKVPGGAWEFVGRQWGTLGAAYGVTAAP